MKLDIEGARRFYSHCCTGLTIGVRGCGLALREIGAHTVDEETLAMVETGSCSVDAKNN